MQTNRFNALPRKVLLLSACILTVTLLLLWGTTTQAQGPTGKPDSTVTPGGEQSGQGQVDLEPTHPAGSGRSDAAMQNAPKRAGPNAVQENDHYQTIAGAAFIPGSSSMTWNYGGGGCINPTATGGWRASLLLPEGSTLETLYFGFYDYSDSYTTTLYLRRYDQRDGTITQLASVQAPGYGPHGIGYDYVYANINNHKTLDYTWWSYVFLWGGIDSTSDVQQLCSVSILYSPPPVFGLALPLVTK